MKQVDLFKTDTKSIRLTDMTKGNWKESRSSNDEIGDVDIDTIVDVYINGTLTTTLVDNVRPKDFFDVIITHGDFKGKKLTIHKDNIYLCY